MTFPPDGKPHKVRRMRWLCLFASIAACSSSSSQLGDAGTCQSADCAALTAPTGVTVVAGNQFALIRWTAAGGAVIDYRVTVSAAGTVLTRQSVQTSVLFAGLSNGVAYQVTVASSVAGGTGPASAPILVTPQAICDRTFALYQTFPAGPGPLTVVAADLDNDGFPDLALTRAGGVSVLINDKFGGFTDKTDYALSTSPGFLVAADFDNSGLPDLAVSGSSTTLFLNDGTGKFDGGVELGFASTMLAAGDFDQSGLPGLIAASSGSATARLFTNSGFGPADGGTGLADAGTVALGVAPAFLAVGDFNADTIVDLAAVNGSQANVEAVLANADGGGGFLPPAGWDGGGNALSLAVADFNADGLSDLATGSADGQLHVQFNFDGGGFSPQQSFDAGAVADFLVAADLDQDSFNDLIYTASTQDKLGVLFNAQDGGFAPAQIFSTGGEPSSVAVADFNDDGFPDLAVANTADGTIGIYISVCK